VSFILIIFRLHWPIDVAVGLVYAHYFFIISHKLAYYIDRLLVWDELDEKVLENRPLIEDFNVDPSEYVSKDHGKDVNSVSNRVSDLEIIHSSKLTLLNVKYFLNFSKF
jgi:hypothetical protein